VAVVVVATTILPAGVESAALPAGTALGVALVPKEPRSRSSAKSAAATGAASAAADGEPPAPYSF